MPLAIGREAARPSCWPLLLHQFTCTLSYPRPSWSKESHQGSTNAPRLIEFCSQGFQGRRPRPGLGPSMSKASTRPQRGFLGGEARGLMPQAEQTGDTLFRRRGGSNNSKWSITFNHPSPTMPSTEGGGGGGKGGRRQEGSCRSMSGTGVVALLS